MWDVLWNSLLLFLPRLLASLVVLVVFWGMGNAAQRLALRLARVRQIDSDLTVLLGSAAKFVLLISTVALLDQHQVVPYKVLPENGALEGATDGPPLCCSS